MTKIVVGYVPDKLHEATVLALLQDGRQPELHDVSMSDHAYFDLLRSVWESGETFVVIEQDVVVYPGAIAAMLECPSPWCATDYFTCGHLQYGFGCTKFEGSFTSAHPEVFERMATGVDFRSAHHSRHFLHLDAQTALVLSSVAGVAWPCRHRPAVTHLNPAHWPAAVRQ